MPKRILWVGEKAREIQLSALRRMFGNDVQTEHRNIVNITQIIQVAEGFDDLVVICESAVIGGVLRAGLRPLWAEVLVCAPYAADWSFGGKNYRFVRFRRISGIAEGRFQFEDLGDNAVRKNSDPGSPSSVGRFAAYIPPDVFRDNKRRRIEWEVVQKIHEIARTSLAQELLYIKPWQRDQGGDQLHPDCKVYIVPGLVQTTSGVKKYYYGESQPEGTVFFQGRLIVDPGNLSLGQVMVRTVSQRVTVQFASGRLKSLRCDGDLRGVQLVQLGFGQKFEDRLVDSNGNMVGWGIVPPSQTAGSWTGTVQFRLFHEPYPIGKMIRL